jgi:hypothetical protein
MFYANAPVIDRTGDVWVPSCSAMCDPVIPGIGSVTEFIGVAAPVSTPTNGPPQLP